MSRAGAAGAAGANPIDVIEAAYALERDDRAWLLGLARAVRPLLEGGRGLYAYAYDASVPPTSWLDRAVLVDADRAELRAAQQMIAARTSYAAEIHVLPSPLASATQGAREAGLADPRPGFDALLGRWKIVDYLALRTVEPGGHGVVVTAAQLRERRVEQRARRLWARVAGHIAAARRLRAALAASTSTAPAAAEPDAVLTPGGKVEHAAGDATSRTARDALRDAVLRQERARGRERRRDPEGATEAWGALVSGRWSLVDQFERGGRRYLVARRNPHELPDPRALTPRERAVAHLAALGKPSKLVAYELGLAESTVATHLAAALRKLGCASRVELVRTLAGLRPR